jgi:proline iminopeptidase
MAAVALGAVLPVPVPSYAQPVREGYVDVDGGKVWYRIVGDGDRTPMLVLHGGPGIPSVYLEPLGGLGTDRPVVFYDQLGCGNSPGGDASNWTIGHFVREVALVRKALGLDEVHLYGHSWGSILAAEHVLGGAQGVRSLILAGPALSLPVWAEDTRALLATLPREEREVITRHENAGTTGSEEYQAAIMGFYSRFVARKQPWEPYLMKAFETMNPELYETMAGPSEFTITGIIRDYDCRERLGGIGVPTLFISGQHDEAVPATTMDYQSRVPGSELAIIPGAGHLAWHDAPELTLAVLGDYMRRVEKE